MSGTLHTFSGGGMCNIRSSIASLMERNILRTHKHPLNILCRRIGRYFQQCENIPLYLHDFPISTPQKTFSELMVPPAHPSRRPSDTFYFNSEFLLRPHMTANERQYFLSGKRQFLLAGKVFRRDEIDKSHFPVFHQLEGVQSNPPRHWGPDPIAGCSEALKAHMSGLIRTLFGSDVESRWTETYFPFTEPSYEMEIFFDGRWVEVLGCGILRPEVLVGTPFQGEVSWAFGIGLERVSMVLNKIKDIRLFWSQNPHFLSQFSYEHFPTQYRELMMIAPIVRDISFWVRPDFSENCLFDLVREHCGDAIESVSKIDSFKHPGSGRESLCYRLCYRSVERSLSEQDVSDLHDRLRESLPTRLAIELR